MQTKNYFLWILCSCFLWGTASAFVVDKDIDPESAKHNAKLNVKISELTVKIGKVENKIAKEEKTIVEVSQKIDKEEKTLKGMNVAYIQMADDTPDKVVDRAKLKKQIEEAKKNVADHNFDISKRELSIAEWKRDVFNLNAEIKGLKRKYQ